MANSKPGRINEKTGFREATAEEIAEAHKKAPRTKAGSHRATARGYANGEIVEEGEPIPAGVPISTEWMERNDGKSDALDEALDAALDPQPDDIDLTKLSKAALEAMAAERNIPVAGLSKDDMITAIKANRQDTA